MTDLYNNTIRWTAQFKEKEYQVEEIRSYKWRKNAEYEHMIYPNVVIEPLRCI